MPERVQDPSFRFGVKTDAAGHIGSQIGKDVIAPVQDKATGELESEAHALYVRSHQAYDPGEQVSRDYSWPAKIVENANAHSFGLAYGASPDGAGVKGALYSHGAWSATADAEAASPPTRLVPAGGEDYRRAHLQRVGGAAPGQAAAGGRPPVPENFTFGAPSRNEATSAGDLIRGTYTAAEQHPDKDLGRCIVEGRRNHTDNDRAFGKPTRSASQGSGRQPSKAFIPPSRTTHGRSAGPGGNAPGVALPGRGVHMQCWTDESGDAAALVAPGEYPSKGVTADDFAIPRKPDEVKSLLEGAGYRFSDDEFKGLWQVAARGSGGGMASLEAVIGAYAASQSS